MQIHILKGLKYELLVTESSSIAALFGTVELKTFLAVSQVMFLSHLERCLYRLCVSEWNSICEDNNLICGNKTMRFGIIC